MLKNASNFIELKIWKTLFSPAYKSSMFSWLEVWKVTQKEKKKKNTLHFFVYFFQSFPCICILYIIDLNLFVWASLFHLTYIRLNHMK